MTQQTNLVDANAYINGLLNNLQDKFTQLASQHKNPLVFTQQASCLYDVLTQFHLRNELQGIPIFEIENSILLGAKLGLSFVPTDGEAFITCNWNETQGRCSIAFLLGYKGMLKLIARDKHVKNATAHVVHCNDEFLFEGSYILPTHRYNPRFDRGPAMTVYATSQLSDGNVLCTLMDNAHFQAIEASARASGSMSWNSEYINALRQKTAIRHHFNITLRSVMEADLSHIETDDLGEQHGY